MLDSENFEADLQFAKERVSVSQESRKSLEEEAPTLDSHFTVTLGRYLLSSTGRDWLSPLYSTRMKVESDARIPGPGGTGGRDAREGV